MDVVPACFYPVNTLNSTDITEIANMPHCAGGNYLQLFLLDVYCFDDSLIFFIFDWFYCINVKVGKWNQMEMLFQQFNLLVHERDSQMLLF